jgi:CheY-like chemotaxis protein
MMVCRTCANPIEILLVEDNPADVRLTEEVFKESRISNNLHVVTDGVEALAYLRREGGYPDAVKPDIILLDLNLPKKDGREVLDEIKRDPELKVIPVIVLTTSSSDRDILHTYTNGANCYITKPVDFEQFMKVIHSLEDFWLTIVRLPSKIS